MIEDAILDQMEDAILDMIEDAILDQMEDAILDQMEENDRGNLNIYLYLSSIIHKMGNDFQERLKLLGWGLKI